MCVCVYIYIYIYVCVCLCVCIYDNLIPNHRPSLNSFRVYNVFDN